MRVWQLNSGPEGRSYADLLVRYGVALIGPGETGAWASMSASAFPRHVTRFAGEVSEGDAILLRVGRSRIVAAGEVASGYQCLPQFDDVGGLDLRHARRVRWFPFATEQEAHHGVPASGGSAFSPVTDGALESLAESSLRPETREWQPAQLPALPPELPFVEDRRPAVREVAAEARDLWSLYSEVSRQRGALSESELVCHLVVPLLGALGWRPELIAVEWRSVDIAVFRRWPRTVANLALLVEAKRVGAVSASALRQAREYLDAMDARVDVVVTDGFTYRRYRAEEGYEPNGYANLVRLKASGVSLLDELASAQFICEVT